MLRRCSALLDELVIPEPFDLAEFCMALGRRRGRRIVLLPMPDLDDLSGAWVGTEVADYVFFRPDTPQLHREHIVLHEIGHILCGHAAASTALKDLTEDGAEEPPVNRPDQEPASVPSLDVDVLAQLLPDFDPALVKSQFGRTDYAAEEEQEVELFATLVLRRAGRRPPASPLPVHGLPHVASPRLSPSDTPEALEQADAPSPDPETAALLERLQSALAGPDRHRSQRWRL